MYKVPIAAAVEKTVGGGTPARNNPEFWDGGIPWASVKDFRDGSCKITKTQERITERGLQSSASHLIPAGTPIVCMRMAVGRIAKADFDIAINQDLRALFAKDAFDSNYLAFAIDSIRPQLENVAIGSTVKGINISHLLAFEIFGPPKPEQTKTANILSTIDQAIERTEILISKQQRIKTGLMHDLLTRGIDEKGAIRSEATHLFKDSPVGRIPADWDAVPLKSVAEFVTSGSRGWAQYYSVDGSLFLRIGNLTRDHINLRFDDVVRVTPPNSSEGRRTSVAAGDVLISITADLGIVGVIPADFEEAYVNQHIALVRIRPEKADSRFLGWFLTGRGGQAQFRRLNESGAKAGLNLPTVERLLVPATKEPLEQARIAQILDATTGHIDNTLLHLRKLKRLKSGLMQDLLTGRKRVTALLGIGSQSAAQGAS